MSVILGIDPGLQRTGWGVIRQSGNALSLVGCGVLTSEAGDDLALRLRQLSEGIAGASTLKLGQARGALLLTLAQARLPVSEYAATLVKKSIVGAGRAEKNQVAQMVQILLPGCAKHGADAMDALAVAITHAHHVTSRQRYAKG